MDDDVPCWNLRCLPSLLQLIEVPVPGINRPYLYFGMWKACFAWHVEGVYPYCNNDEHWLRRIDCRYGFVQYQLSPLRQAEILVCSTS